MILTIGPVTISNEAMVGWVIQYQSKTANHRIWKRYKKFSFATHSFIRKDQYHA